jgi:hypothetical protein
MFRRLATLALSLSLTTTAFAERAATHDQPTPRTGIERLVDEPPIKREPLVLDKKARAIVKRALAKRRDRTLAAFAAYVKRGVYPHYDPAAENAHGPIGDLGATAILWKDGGEHLGALASILTAAKEHDLVSRVFWRDNHALASNAPDEQAIDWFLMSGLTLAELDAIEVPLERIDGTRTIKQIDASLKGRYRTVQKQLARARSASLEAAIDRLCQAPHLVARVLAGDGKK